MDHFLQKLAAVVADIPVSYPLGRLTRLGGNRVEVSGFPAAVQLGDRVVIDDAGGRAGEVVALRQGAVDVLLDGPGEGLRIGVAVRLLPPRRFAPDESWVGRVVDPDGQPLDGRPLLPGMVEAPLQRRPPAPHRRRPLGARVTTGVAALNTFLPLVRGQRIGLFAGSGVGKSTLLGDLAREVEADIIVIALVGERGRELRHFVDDVLGPAGLSRAVVVAATSDRAPQVRRRCAWAATAVAEHFRDQGLHVLLLCDSVTRFCEAHREVAGAAGEPANLRGFPASTAGAIAALCERAGPGEEGSGDITAIYTVLVAGSDMEEPVADMLRGVLDGHIVLDRKIAEQGRFPAIDIMRSVSRALPAAATRIENDILQQARRLIGAYENAALMVQAGLYVAGSDPLIDKALACQPALEKFLVTKDRRPIAAHFAALKQVLDTPVEPKRSPR